MKHWASTFMAAFSPGSSLWVRRGTKNFRFNFRFTFKSLQVHHRRG
jgi:hypothetical protein